jgi:membrane-associated phospholipid phosphatase
MSNRDALRAWLIAFVLCVIVVIFSIAYVDRPVADYVNANFLDSHFFAWFGKQLGRLAVFVGLGFAFLGASGLWVLSGRRLPSWTEIPLLSSWSLMWATGATVTLKRAFGRSDVQSWTGSTPEEGHLGINKFHFLHGGPPNIDSFPSGTTTVAAAIIAVIWILVPRLRILCVLALVGVSIGLVITNSHFVADVIAGIFVGWSVGWMTVRLLRPIPSPR